MTTDQEKFGVLHSKDKKDAGGRRRMQSKEFERIMSEGCEEHKALWYLAHSSTQRWLLSAGYDVSHPEIKHLTAGIVNATLRAAARFHGSVK